tara:strand:+ start:978 stop:1157 length:180 start_codon:yes stop_codon:yes gene_type:complete
MTREETIEVIERFSYCETMSDTLDAVEYLIAVSGLDIEWNDMSDLHEGLVKGGYIEDED